MASETEPNSTPIAERTLGPAQRIVRLQGGGLRFLDAHEIPQLDFNGVTRPFQNNNTQHWMLTNVGGNIHTIQQVSTADFSTRTKSQASISAWSRARNRTTTPSAGVSSTSAVASSRFSR
jgi:hypothetical protein